MNLCLRVTPGAERPFVYRCGSDVVIGRSQSADLSIPCDRFLSKRHARVFQDTGAWYVEDLGSRNTTLLNGNPVDERARVLDGDVIRLSDCRIEVSITPRSGDDTAVYRPAAAVLDESDAIGRLQRTPGEPSLKRYAERLALLNEVHRALANRISQEELFELVLDRAFTHLGAEEGVIFLENDDGELERAATRRKPEVTGGDFYSRRLANVVARRGMAALVHDVHEDERFSGAESLLAHGIRSIVAAPLAHRPGRAGMIVLATRAVVHNFNHEDMEFLVSLASVAALRLRNLELHEEAKRRAQLQKELEIARRIQVALFPRALPSVEGYELYACNRPSRTVSGDLYRIESRGATNECVLFVADVSGKGIAASLLTASLEALAMGPIEMGRAPDEVCDKVSRRLHARTPPERYATAFLGVLDPETGAVRYANAGHNPALVLRRDGAIEELGATGIPLGIMPNASYECGQVALAAGDALIIYTDGITEAKNERGEEFDGHLQEACRKHRHRSAAALADAISSSLERFIGSRPYEDDRTLVIARRSIRE